MTTIVRSVVALYGQYPVHLDSSRAIPRLNAQLLTLLADANPSWDVMAISPETGPLRGVQTMDVPFPATARAWLKLRSSHAGRRFWTRSSGISFRKSRWGTAAAARLAESRPDKESTVLICTHAEVVEAARRAMPGARIIHWIHTPVLSGRGQEADAAVVGSLAVYELSWRRGGDRFKPPMWVIPNWVDTELFKPMTSVDRASARSSLGLGVDDLVVVFVDRHWIKGGQVAEAAISALGATARKVVLLSAGGPEPGRRALSANSEVRALGTIQPSELSRMFGVADVGVMPSVNSESFGMAALEMMSSGLPVIASRAGGLPEVVEDAVTGLLIDPPNGVDAWTEAIARLIDDPEWRRTMGSAGRQLVLDRHTPEQAMLSWSRVITQVGTHPQDAA